MPKSFTLAEVNQLVPEVETRLSAIRAKRVIYLRIHDAVFVQELANDAEKKVGPDFFDSEYGKYASLPFSTRSEMKNIFHFARFI